jgi:hypothetical protein
MMDINTLNMTIPEIQTAYRQGTLTPQVLIEHLLTLRPIGRLFG